LSRIVLVSNRVAEVNCPGKPGGVGVILADILRGHPGLWFGWNGAIEEDAQRPSVAPGAGEDQVVTVPLSSSDFSGYYLGYSNSVLWPVFHNRLDLAQFEAGFYESYVDVNRRFASLLLPLLDPSDFIWVHDYHFIPMARELRRLGANNAIGFFLHIPFAPAQTMLAIPEFAQLAAGFSEYDLIGTQTQLDVRNFIDFIEQGHLGALLPSGKIRVLSREVSVGCFPASISAADFLDGDGDDEEMPRQGAIDRIIGIDRLDYTKGLPQKFKAFAKALEDNPELRGRVVLSQFAPPTRESVEAYADIRAELEALSGSINGRFGEIDWIPINYIHRAIARSELRSLYRSSRVGWVSPLRDGMNLVAKEYVVSQDPRDPGVLLLSKFAGAAEQLTEALIVNPYDVGEMAAMLVKALRMPLDERIARHGALLAKITATDAARWSSSFIAQLKKAGRTRTSARGASLALDEAVTRLQAILGPGRAPEQQTTLQKRKNIS